MARGTVLIYGGTGGIGLAIARRLRDRGHPLHLVARDRGRLEAAAAELGGAGPAELGSPGFTVGDVAAGDGPFAAAAEAAASGPLAGLVYAVGTIDLKPLARLTPAEVERDFRVNALGALRAVQAAAPALKEAGREAPSAIVLFSTVAVAQGFSAHASVAMAKGAVEGLTLSLAAELAPHVRVNAVAPSLTRTPLAAALTAKAGMAGGIAAMHAIPRLGEPDDPAALAAFLVSEEAGWITGQVIGVDGGRSRVRTKG